MPVKLSQFGPLSKSDANSLEVNRKTSTPVPQSADSVLVKAGLEVKAIGTSVQTVYKKPQNAIMQGLQSSQQLNQLPNDVLSQVNRVKGDITRMEDNVSKIIKNTSSAIGGFKSLLSGEAFKPKTKQFPGPASEAKFKDGSGVNSGGTKDQPGMSPASYTLPRVAWQITTERRRALSLPPIYFFVNPETVSYNQGFVEVLDPVQRGYFLTQWKDPKSSKANYFPCLKLNFNFQSSNILPETYLSKNSIKSKDQIAAEVKSAKDSLKSETKTLEAKKASLEDQANTLIKTDPVVADYVITLEGYEAAKLEGDTANMAALQKGIDATRANSENVRKYDSLKAQADKLVPQIEEAKKNEQKDVGPKSVGEANGSQSAFLTESLKIPPGLQNWYDIISIFHEDKIIDYKDLVDSGIDDKELASQLNGLPNYVYLSISTRIYPMMTLKGFFQNGYNLSESAHDPLKFNLPLDFTAFESDPMWNDKEALEQTYKSFWASLNPSGNALLSTQLNSISATTDSSFSGVPQSTLNQIPPKPLNPIAGADSTTPKEPTPVPPEAAPTDGLEATGLSASDLGVIRSGDISKVCHGLDTTVCSNGDKVTTGVDAEDNGFFMRESRATDGTVTTTIEKTSGTGSDLWTSTSKRVDGTVEHTVSQPGH
jgi:hypothetical protein